MMPSLAAAMFGLVFAMPLAVSGLSPETELSPEEQQELWDKAVLVKGEDGQFHYTDYYCSGEDAGRASELPGLLLLGANPHELQRLLNRYPNSCSDARAEIQKALDDVVRAPQWLRVDANGRIEKAHAPDVPRFVEQHYLTERVLGWPRTPLDEMVEAPSPKDLDAVYPDLAWRRDIIGVVTLEGRAGADSRFVWRVISITDDVRGYRFDEAAIRYASKYKAPPQLNNGKPTEGLAAIVVVPFVKAPKKPIYQE